MRIVSPQILVAAVIAAAGLTSPAVAAPTFERRLLNEVFLSEGACFADLDGDGDQDVVSGPLWFEGPDFKAVHEYAPSGRVPIAGYSEFFFTFAHDFNGDGRVDILAIPMPGDAAHWFENPGEAAGGGHWRKHLAFEGVDNESPVLADLTGDGRPELVCCHAGGFGFAEPRWDAPTEPWRFTAISDDRGLGRFTHGLGVGDVDGDGRLDVLETNGWWEQPEKKGERFTFHPAKFAEAGGAQMFAFDVDGDGDHDVVSSQNAHAWGLAWFEQVRDDAGGIGFRRHDILTGNVKDHPAGLAISQMHALALADMDGDGVEDVVTGKRFWAHGGNDPGAHELPVLYWFRTVRSADGAVEFEPHLVDANAGVGTQLTVGDVDGDDRPDIVVGNKLGTSVFLQRGEDAPGVDPAAIARRREEPKVAHTPGTDLFAAHVRTTQPLDPAEEQATFVVPPGFEIDLVAAEPDIAKPMNLAFDARGRLWVTSTVEYPYPAPDEREGRDTVKVLEDADGDGTFETITTFAEGLNIPIGLIPWRDGVVVFSIPSIWFLRDTDGDGRADSRERLYGPFDTTRDTHGMCNSFTRGLDGWLYACHGFNNQSTVAGTDGHEITMQSGNTFRMRFDGSRVEHVTHGQVNPFGMTFDRRNDFFTADCHTKPVTLLLPGGHYESFGKPHDGLGFVPNVMEHLHGSTAIAGMALGEGTAFPKAWQASTFGGNVMTSRVNRNTIVRNGSSVRVEAEPDLVISGDPWFRPVDLVVGPDGALYIADFYNRIIGHYEVPLAHPGRDRHRGRIWRVRHRDAPHAGPHPASLDLAGTVAALGSPIDARANLAVARLADEFGSQAADPVRAAWASLPAMGRARALWVLHQAGVLDGADLKRGLDDSDPLVRIHACRVLGEDVAGLADPAAALAARLGDPDPAVRRAAATAAAARPSAGLVRPLVSLATATPAEADPHLHHAARIALRDHLVHDDWFAALRAGDALAPAEIDLVAGICLAVRTEGAGAFLADHLDRLADRDAAHLSDYLRFAIRYASGDALARLVPMARARFVDDPARQQELLDAIAGGVDQRGIPMPDSVRQWAADLAGSLLGTDGAALPLAWTYVPVDGAPDEGNPWVVSTRRNSADGVTETPLWSSFPNGEQRTGTIRSEPFELGDRFTFFVAGHDGFPDQPVQGRNLVRLRDADTHAVLRETAPPRNDVAQPVVWDTAAESGHRAYVEMTDGDTGDAYAWLAVGRFSVAGLNPSDTRGRQQRGAAVAARFRLDELRPVLGRIATTCEHDAATSSAVAGALAALRPDPRLAALAEIAGLEATTAATRATALGVLAEGDPDKAPAALADAVRTAGASLRTRIATRLADDATGAGTLVDLAEAGHVPASLLKQPDIAAKLEALGIADLQARVNTLAGSLPDEDARIADLLASRRQEYLGNPGSVSAGAAHFQTHCAVCHQVAGQGGQLAPNLDGIGNRGLERILEDVLAPNRNVDVAFRMTTLVTRDGSVHSGFVRRAEGNQTILADTAGQESAIATDSIASRNVLPISLMPPNFGDVLPPEDFRDLVAYLLSLRNG